MSVVADAPVQPSLRRIRQFAVRPDRELGQNFLIDSNILGVIDRASQLDRRDVVLEVGGGLGVLSEYLAAARRPRARGGGRRAPAGGARRRDRRPRQRDRALGRCDDDRPARPRPGADEGGGQPALRDRRGRAAAHDRGAPEREQLGGDGAARGRRAPGGGPGGRRLRHAVGDRPARVRGGGGAGDPTHRVPPGAQRRLGAGAPAPASSERTSRSRRRCARSSPARSRTGARRSPARWRCPGARAAAARASRCARRSVGSAIPPTCAPSASRRRTFARWRLRWSYEREARQRRGAMSVHRALAPAKVNLGLFVGPARVRGRQARAGDGDAVDLAGR